MESSTFDRLCKDPEAWLFTAIGHLLSAKTLFNECEKIFALTNSEYEIYRVGYSRAFMLLSAFAFENLLKGILVGRNPESNPVDHGHELVKMASKVTKELSSEERNLLERLQVYLKWAGRYNLPKNLRLAREILPKSVQMISTLRRLFSPGFNRCLRKSLLPGGKRIIRNRLALRPSSR